MKIDDADFGVNHVFGNSMVAQEVGIIVFASALQKPLPLIAIWIFPCDIHKIPVAVQLHDIPCVQYAANLLPICIAGNHYTAHVYGRDAEPVELVH